MNKARRAAIRKIHEAISELRDQLEAVIDEERDAYENMPESLQSSERGEAMSEGIDEMDEISSDLEDLINRLETISEG